MAMLVNANPHGNHYYTTRYERILAIVCHITAGLEDLDATDDHSAERTAQYAASTDRSVSWHYGTDSDSTLDLLPDSYTAWHCRNYNSCTLGHEISKRHTDWRSMPKVWLDRTLHNAARADARRCVDNNIPIRHATQAELDHARQYGGAPVGLIGHWELDPGRRSDPGLVGAVLDTFPWDAYLALIRHYARTIDSTPDPLPTEDDDDMMIIWDMHNPEKNHRGAWLLAGGDLTPLPGKSGFNTVVDLKSKGVPEHEPDSYDVFFKSFYVRRLRS